MKRLSKRKCEMWISNNKVLIGGGGKKPHARNPNFETEETKLLISLWGDPKVQKTLITTHKKHPVILKLADQMREHGYHRSADEINTRIKNLKCFYNRIKKDVEMGIITEPTWKHYNAMEEIVTRPVFGNRVQQPHLQHLLQQADSQNIVGDFTATSSDMEEDDSIDGLRPEDLLSVKEDGQADMEFEDARLVPKDEPVDIDDMEADTEHCEVADVDDIFPKLSQYLQQAAAKSKSKNSSNPIPRTISPGLEIKTSPRSSPEPPQHLAPTAQLLSALSLTPTVFPVSTPSVTSTAIIPASTNTSNTSCSTLTSTTTTSVHQNKISLVPTNILMKPKTTSTPVPPITIKQSNNQPQSISFGGEQYVCADTMCNGKSVYTSAQKDGKPMKVLLVNTIQQKPLPPTVSIPASNITKTKADLVPKPISSISTPIKPISGTSTVVSNNGATAVVVTSAPGPVMPKPKILPISGVAPPPVYSTRSARANALKNMGQPISIAAEKPSTPAACATTKFPKKRSSSPPTVRQSQLGSGKRTLHLNSFKSQLKSSPAGFRSLLTHLVALQNETLAVSRKRLDVEQSRLSFEKSMGSKLLEVLKLLAEKK